MDALAIVICGGLCLVSVLATLLVLAAVYVGARSDPERNQH